LLLVQADQHSSPGNCRCDLMRPATTIVHWVFYLRKLSSKCQTCELHVYRVSALQGALVACECRQDEVNMESEFVSTLARIDDCLKAAEVFHGTIDRIVKKITPASPNQAVFDDVQVHERFPSRFRSPQSHSTSLERTRNLCAGGHTSD
jgi:hypothetical protein